MYDSLFTKWTNAFSVSIVFVSYWASLSKAGNIKKKAKVKVLWRLSNFELCVYKTQMSQSDRTSPFGDLSPSSLSDSDYPRPPIPPPTPLFEESHAERKLMASQARSGDRIEQSKSGRQPRGSSLVTNWSPASHAFTMKQAWPTVFPLTGGKSLHLPHP